MTDEEIWAGYLAGAAAAKASVPTSLAAGIAGRFIAVMSKRLVEFWGKHRATLVPCLTQLAIAALDALAAQLINIITVDPPGPQ